MRYLPICLLVLGVAGCPTRPPVSCSGTACKDAAVGGDGDTGGSDALGADAGTNDASAVDAGDTAAADAARTDGDGGGRYAAGDVVGDVSGDGSGDGSDGQVATTIRLVSPLPMTYANGDVSVDVVFEGPGTSSVQLLRNGSPWVVIGAPYHYAWNTRLDAEGPYVLTAQAAVGAAVLTSDPVTAIVDRTPPQVTSVTPVAGSTAVDVLDPITVTFSEPLLRSSVSATAIQVSTGGMIVSGPAALSSDGMSVTLQTAVPRSLTLPATMTGTLAGTISDRAGNTLTPVAGAWMWLVPDWVKLPPVASAKEPRFAIGADGRPVVLSAALEMVSGNFYYNLHVARFDGAQWDASLGVPTPTVSTAQEGYGLTLDSGGRPVVAWTQDGVGERVVRVGAWTGAAWDSASYPALNNYVGASRDGRWPSVRMDVSDHPVVAWRESTGLGGGEDYVAAHWTGSAWTMLPPAGFVTPASDRAGGPELTIDGSGNPIFGWSVIGSGSGLAIWGGSSWSVTVGLAGGFTPTPALDVAGAPMVAVKGTTLRVLKYVSGAWADEVAGAVVTGASWVNPRLRTARDGLPVVAWTDTTGPVRIGVARWDGTTWDTRFGLFNGGQVVFNTAVPELAVDVRGHVWVAWLEGTAIQVWMSNY
jgi:hypothetical protein